MAESKAAAQPARKVAFSADALSPTEAVARMSAPAGFRVDLVAAEPDIHQPVAFAFDERGRIWVAESLEYPRKQAGQGEDRIKVLEDTDGDGKADKFSIFADGLNIPSGVAVGHAGALRQVSYVPLLRRYGEDLAVRFQEHTFS